MEDYMIQILIMMETESLMHTSIQLWMIWFSDMKMHAQVMRLN